MKARELWLLLAAGICAALFSLLFVGWIVLMPRAAHADDVQIPEASAAYRIQVERAAASYFGLDASAARLAAQIHAESTWQASAQSSYARGLAQFTPATADWLPTVCPELGEFDPWDAGQAIRGAACYDAWLLGQLPRDDPCDGWAFALAAYNGGIGWLRRDIAVAIAQGADPQKWFDHVELHSRRARWAWIENRTYVERVLLHLEPAYVAAGWPGDPVCP